MSEKIGYWPGSNNDCDMYKGCRGAGSPEHINHSLAAIPIVQLMGRILSHCGDRMSPFMSCLCCRYAEEIGRRAALEGQAAHRKAVEHMEKYYQEKYPALKENGEKK